MKPALVLVISLLLVGCVDNDMGDLRRYVEDVKGRSPAMIDPLPEFRQAESFLYVPGGRRNPFAPENDEEAAPVSLTETEGPQPDPNRPREELESYELASLQMVGTLEKDGEVWGLVQTDDGTIFRVQPDNYMGRNHGRVIRVNEDRIELTELVQNATGGYFEQEAALSLSEE